MPHRRRCTATELTKISEGAGVSREVVVESVVQHLKQESVAFSVAEPCGGADFVALLTVAAAYGVDEILQTVRDDVSWTRLSSALSPGRTQERREDPTALGPEELRSILADQAKATAAMVRKNRSNRADALARGWAKATVDWADEPAAARLPTEAEWAAAIALAAIKGFFFRPQAAAEFGSLRGLARVFRDPPYDIVMKLLLYKGILDARDAGEAARLEREWFSTQQAAALWSYEVATNDEAVPARPTMVFLALRDPSFGYRQACRRFGVPTDTCEQRKDTKEQRKETVVEAAGGGLPVRGEFVPGILSKNYAPQPTNGGADGLEASSVLKEGQKTPPNTCWAAAIAL